MTNSLQSALINFKKAAYDLHSQWVAEGETFILNTNYPFQIDFAQVVSDISNWADSSVEKLSAVQISSNILENTGGGAYVSYSSIVNGGELKMIGVSRECIVGYDTWYEEATGDEDVLWHINVGDWSNLQAVRKQLTEKVPTLADELITQLIVSFGYDALKDAIDEYWDGEQYDALFIYEDMAIRYPFTDEYDLQEVDPITHYGIDNIIVALSKI